ncbi:MAG: cyclopropane-fatty-acyl-phospholipid synthase [Gammaproteobacteria bacterium]|nr:cyclopropane-fatty-acyl-phospholipid synthase [Gammaproteobacteria bacterium]
MGAWTGVFRNKINKGTLTITEPGHGKTPDAKYTFGDNKPHVTWIMHHHGTLGRIVRNPALNLGKTYMNQEWDVGDGNLHDLLMILRENLEDLNSPRGPLDVVTSLLSSWNNLTASLSNVSHHYDIDESLFRGFLDRDRYYSCAYFREPDMSLESAQLAKANHIEKKLRLKPGQRVLDIGCGWGSLAMHLAESAGVEVVGVTLSEEQLRAAKTEARRRGLTDRVDFRLEDYRRHEGTYDGIVSVGMFEHVGKRNFRSFFDHVTRMLKSDGTALIHTIGQHRTARPSNAWIRRHIFPGGYIPALSEVIHAVEPTSLVTTDIEVLRRHYALTLKEWNRRFQTIRSEIAQQKGERFCRMWEFYIVACETAFEAGALAVFQLQLSHRSHATPLTRDYLYQDDVAQIVVTEDVDALPRADPKRSARHP